MSTNPEPAKDDAGHPTPAVDISALWDVDAHHRAGGKLPWSFFAYPKTLADEQGLPPDAEAVRYLWALHRAGVRVGIDKSPYMPDDIFFACPIEESQRLQAAIEDLER